MSKFQKPQSGNPHQLTINQHVFPRASIQRFANASGRVKVRILSSRKVIDVEPDHDIFCVKRAWDQRHERLVGKQIEDEFQAIADQVMAGRSSLAPEHHDTVTYFRSLWQLRDDHRENPISDRPANGLTPTDLTLDQREVLESKHVAYIDQHGNFPGRMIAGLQIQRGMDHYADRNAGARWGILRAKSGDFILPDRFGEFGFVPISPKCVLMIGAPDTIVQFAGVQNFNRAALREAKRYVVARSFSACPI